MADYYDTSALAKLVVAEAETDALRAWIGQRGEAVTSDLARTELLRLARRIDPSLTGRVREVLDSLIVVQITSALFTAAGRLDPAAMRSLDAIHLAAALDLGDDLDSLVAYDVRLLEAAHLHGVATSSPRAAD